MKEVKLDSRQNILEGFCELKSFQNESNFQVPNKLIKYFYLNDIVTRIKYYILLLPLN